ncbi:MAG: twin-arginine translocase TatA/TatE family subunit [Bacteriovoracaceae bacterium]|nr:twin-arginine translocase TatA/TatE family subunit [Bacteriovoracaceae bacterium]
MFGLGAGEILLILLFALIFIGPKKLPELARGLGKGIREFQKAKDDLLDPSNSVADNGNTDSLPTGVSEPSENLAHSETALEKDLPKTKTQEVKEES